MGGGPADRPAARRALRRHHHRRRPFQHGLSVDRDVLPGAVPDRDRHGAAEGQRQRHRRAAVRPARQAPRRGLLHFLHGDQPWRVHRAPRVRVSGTAGELACGICGGRHRNGDWRHPVHAGRQVPGRRRAPPRAGGIA